jgi:hypothetical protein
MRSGVEFSTCGVMLQLKEFQNLEHLGFWILELGILNLIKIHPFCILLTMELTFKEIPLYLRFDQAVEKQQVDDQVF